LSNQPLARGLWRALFLQLIAFRTSPQDLPLALGEVERD